MVNQSQINQSLGLVELVGSGEDSQEDDYSQGGTEVETEELQSYPDDSANGSGADFEGFCAEEATELFELCQEIQNIVSKAEPPSPIVIDEDFSCANELNEIVEKFYVTVEEEKSYSDSNISSQNNCDSQSEINQAFETSGDINMVDYIDEDFNIKSCFNLPSEIDFGNSQKDITDDTGTINPDCTHSYSDFFESSNIFNDFESLLKTDLPTASFHVDNSTSVLPSLSPSSESSVGINSDWDDTDLFHELFPSLSP